MSDQSRRPRRVTDPAADAIVSWDEVSIADEHRLRRRHASLRTDTDRNRFAGALRSAQARLARRRASVPSVGYPPELPVSAARDEIAEALAHHQVIVVAGETGSGKTTQLPKICLELGRGVRGMVGHTQPRRIAARAVAARIAEETGTELGATVGYSVRFDDRVGDDSLVKVMTDGILLREMSRDPELRAYDTIIVDEAHERSLNIDFILGFLKQLLPRRPDLKVVITSATIDPGRFAEHFATADMPVPVVTVSGRTYPVEVRYRPRTVPTDDPEREHDDIDQVQAIRGAIEELSRDGPGDILVFLATEREIRDTADALKPLTDNGTQILQLFSRLSNAAQHAVFTVSTRRRIILSTNIAETSLTVPGIRYVVDAGTARVSRYSLRTKVQRLPIEPVSQASARQRAGRCGRVADGICIRLYSQDDFDARPEFTEPEILRTNLASVILTMTSLGLGDIAAFPFVEAPDVRSVRDGMALLDELGAVQGTGGSRRLTPIGRDLADLPLDPRWARMLLAGRDNGALAEMLVIVSALSLPDVRERPAEHRQAADEAHRRHAVAGSDFLSILALWNHLDDIRRELSASQFRKRCEREFLHWLRIREWRELHRQLERITVEKKWASNTVAAAPAVVHQSLLAGLLGHLGVREGESREFSGARGTRFVVFPGSPLAVKPPRFVMAAEVVETSRLFARTVAAIEPEWAEKIAGSLAKRSYSEPHWSIRRGCAMAYERVTLYGVPLVAHRAVPFGRIDPEVSRELFIRHALVDGEWRTSHQFFARNRALLDDVRDLEHRSRRGDLVITDDELFDFYDGRIGPDVVSGAHFDTWWKKTRATRPDLLDLTRDVVTETGAVSATEFPDHWQQGEARLALTYQFAPGTDRDGVTVHIPVALLPRIRPSGFDWLVPGMRTELAVALIRTLPKAIRRRLPPAADAAGPALHALTPRSEPIVAGLARELTRRTGVSVAADDFDPAALPEHLRMTYVAVDDAGTTCASAASLAELVGTVDGAESTSKRAITPTGADGPSARRATGSTTSSSQRHPPTVVTQWTPTTVGTLEETAVDTIAGQRVTSYPSLRPHGGGVIVEMAPTAAQAREQTHRAIVVLLELSVPPLKQSAPAALQVSDRLALSQSPYENPAAMVGDCTRAAIRSTVGATDGIRTSAAFAELRARVARDAPHIAREILATVGAAMTRMATIRSELDRLSSGPAVDDVADQLDQLVYDGFIADTARPNLLRLGAYLDAIIMRLERLPAAAPQDARSMAALDTVTAAWNDTVGAAAPARRAALDEQIHWMVEELRVGLFAERIGTAYPVSEKRVLRAITALRS